MNSAVHPDTERLGTGPVPIEPYRSADFFTLERERLFARAWIYAGREVQLPNPGDYLVKEIDICDASVIVVRGRDMRLRAFHNVCSHRSGRIVWDNAPGHASNFSCPYHGWGYSLEGELRVVPDDGGFACLDRAGSGLNPVAIDTTHGFIFINLAPEPAQTLAEFLCGFQARLDLFDYSRWTTAYSFVSEIDNNWKCVLDNFQETYHLCFTHANSFADRSISAENPFGRPLGFSFFGPHRLMEVWSNPSHRTATVEGVAGAYGGVIAQTAMQDTTRDPHWGMDAQSVFPNIMLDVTPAFFLTHETMPLAVDRTRLQSTIWFAEARTAGERFSQEYTAAAFRDSIAEDVAVLDMQYKAIRSGAKTAFHFHDTEIMCRHLIHHVQRFIETGKAGPA